LNCIHTLTFLAVYYQNDVLEYEVPSHIRIGRARVGSVLGFFIVIVLQVKLVEKEES